MDPVSVIFYAAGIVWVSVFTGCPAVRNFLSNVPRGDKSFREPATLVPSVTRMIETLVVTPTPISSHADFPLGAFSTVFLLSFVLLLVFGSALGLVVWANHYGPHLGSPSEPIGTGLEYQDAVMQCDLDDAPNSRDAAINGQLKGLMESDDGMIPGLKSLLKSTTDDYRALIDDIIREVGDGTGKVHDEAIHRANYFRRLSEEFEALFDKAVADRQAKQADLDTASLAHMEDEATLAAKGTQLDKIMEESNRVATDLEGSKSDLVQARRQHEEFKRDSDRAMSELQAELDNADDTNDILKSDLAKANKTIADLMQQLLEATANPDPSAPTQDKDEDDVEGGIDDPAPQASGEAEDEKAVERPDNLDPPAPEADTENEKATEEPDNLDSQALEEAGEAEDEEVPEGPDNLSPQPEGGKKKRRRKRKHKTKKLIQE